jgi:hypothetical protein
MRKSVGWCQSISFLSLKSIFVCNNWIIIHYVHEPCFVIHSWIHGYLHQCYGTAIMNRATVNTNTQIHLLCTYFDFHGIILGSDMAGWYGSTTVSLLLNLHIHFHSGCSAWHCQHLLCFVFLMRNCNENCNVVFICISPIYYIWWASKSNDILHKESKKYCKVYMEA